MSTTPTRFERFDPKIAEAMIRTNDKFGGLPAWIPIALVCLLPFVYVLVRMVMGTDRKSVV
jgi:hypothetical protein